MHCFPAACGRLIVAAYGRALVCDLLTGILPEGGQVVSATLAGPEQRHALVARRDGVQFELRSWRWRLVSLETPNTEPGRGLCLEPHDCVVSKLVAGRRKDHDFARALLREHLVDADTLIKRIDLLSVAQEQKARLRAWVGKHR